MIPGANTQSLSIDQYRHGIGKFRGILRANILDEEQFPGIVSGEKINEAVAINVTRRDHGEFPQQEIRVLAQDRPRFAINGGVGFEHALQGVMPHSAAVAHD